MHLNCTNNGYAAIGRPIHPRRTRALPNSICKIRVLSNITRPSRPTARSFYTTPSSPIVVNIIFRQRKRTLMRPFFICLLSYEITVWCFAPRTPTLLPGISPKSLPPLLPNVKVRSASLRCAPGTGSIQRSSPPWQSPTTILS